MLRPRRVRAQGALEYAEPRFVPWVYWLMRAGCPLYSRWSEGVDSLEVRGIERLIRSYQRFYRREARLLLGFRHAAVHDPPVMFHLLTRILPREARRRRLPLGGLAHTHFLYGRGVTLWAGGGSAFALPRIAGLPVINRRSDVQALRTLRRHLTEGPYPVTLAPEGQVTYHNHRLGPLEAGSARLALWCLEELERQGRAEEVLLLPVGLEYRFDRQPERLLAALVRRIAEQGGLPAPSGEARREALLELTEGLVAKIEAYYAAFFPAAAGEAAAAGDLQGRIERLCDRALRVPEGFMGLEPGQDLLSRVFTVRQRGWDFLFRGDVPPRGRAAPLDRALADRLADEAYLRLRHNELVDVLEYVRPDYIGPGASLNRLCEYALNLADVLNRLEGGDISSRFSPPHKRVVLRIGEPIAVRALCAGLPGGAKSRGAALLEALRGALEELSREEGAGTPPGGVRA